MTPQRAIGGPQALNTRARSHLFATLLGTTVADEVD